MTAVRRQREGGSLSLEFAIIAPAVLVLIGLAVVGGRVVVAGGAVDQAAAAAAREASISRDAVSAQARGVRIAQETLQNQNLHCRDVTVDLDLSAFAQPVGTSGAVRVTVSCLVGLEGLGVPGVPGQRRLEGTAISVIDRYRAR